MTDPATLDRIVSEQGIHTEAQPRWGSYAVDLQDFVAGLLVDILGGTGGASAIADVLAQGLIVGLPLLLVLLYRKRLWGLLRTNRGPKADPLCLNDPTVAARDPEAEARELLADGSARQALAALWRALAQRLSAEGQGRWSAELTHREFVHSIDPDSSARARLEGLVDRVDHLAYGPAEPPVEDVRRLADALP